MGRPVALTGLAAELGLLDGARHHVAIVGGGGKTTLAFALAEQLPGRSVVTSTTKMGADQHRGLPLLVGPTDDELLAAATTSVVVAWRRVDEHKAVGVGPEQCDRWFALVDHVLVEADGSRRLPFKAPGPDEPVVPATTTLLLSTIGADALGRVIVDSCHRPLRVAALAGCRPSERLTPVRAARVLLHERGPRRAAPVGCRLAVVVNKVDDRSLGRVEELVGELANREPALTVVAIALDPEAGE